MAEFELTAAVQEDAERDEVGVRRDLGGDFILGPRAGSRGGGDVVGRVFPGIWAGCLGWRGLAWAGDAEYQQGAVVVGAQARPAVIVGRRDYSFRELVRRYLRASIREQRVQTALVGR